MKGTLSGWHHGSRVAVEVSANLMDRFRYVRRLRKLTESELVGYILAEVPEGQSLTERHIESFLDKLEGAGTGKQGSGTAAHFG